MKCGIYVIVSPSGRCYIGSTKDFTKRKRDHFYRLRKGNHGCDGLQAAYAKYGDQLSFMIIEYCEESQLIQREQWWIDNHKAFWGRMYNSSGIAGRPQHTAEARKKMSDHAKGRSFSAETRAKISAAGRGRKHSQETINKIKSHGVIGAKPSGDHIEKMHAAINADERRKRAAEMGRANRGRKHTPEALQRMSDAHRRRIEARGN